MWSIFKQYLPIKYLSLAYLKRTFTPSPKSIENSRELWFPWTQIVKDDYKTPPFLHKIAGLFIMKRILQNVNAPFKNQEFLEGVEFAINAVSKAIATQDVKKIQGMMGTQLAQCFQNAFQTLSAKHQSICLDLEKTKLLKITGIKSIFGKADPSDKQILRVCGQEIVSSKRKLESVIEESESPWNDSRHIGETAAKLGVTFQVDVKFMSQERFYIGNGTDINLGSKEVKSCYHIWQFESRVDWLSWDTDSGDSYPIAWELSDMDQFLEKNFPSKDSPLV